ncbi:MAG: hypothetical protein IPK53_18430 [bacterium]|nr:hypothetical protein [bacterium]MBK8130792.1 hypothetical protein [bacterium]
MKPRAHSLFRSVALLTGILAVALFTLGCSLFEAPTANSDSADTATDLWNPQPGDEIVPGRPIPVIMDEDYWDAPGMDINPNRRPVGQLGATPVPIDGAVGGIVRCGSHNFVVPVGAIDGTVNFTLALASGTGIGVDCGPSPLFFADGSPVRLSLSYAGTQYDPDYCERAGIEPLDASQLQIWYMAPDGSLTVEQAERFFDPAAKTISVSVDHFSRYIIA